MRIQWSAQLATGIRTIDLQHEELVEIINDFDRARTDGDTADNVDRLLERLSAYVLFHFGTEEALLDGNPRLAQHAATHRREHCTFSERVAAFKGAAADDRAAVMAQLGDYLANWIVAHIMHTDQEMARLLGAQGGR